jgi:hypothetical protein
MHSGASLRREGVKKTLIPGKGIPTPKIEGFWGISPRGRGMLIGL